MSAIAELLIVVLLAGQVGLLCQVRDRVGLVASNQRRAHEQEQKNMEQTAATLVGADSRAAAALLAAALEKAVTLADSDSQTAATLADADSRRQATTGTSESVNTTPIDATKGSS